MSPFVYENESVTDVRPDAIGVLLGRSEASDGSQLKAVAPAALFVCIECGREMDDPVGRCGHCTMRRAMQGQHVPLLFALVVSFAFLTRMFLLFMP